VYLLCDLRWLLRHLPWLLRHLRWLLRRLRSLSPLRQFVAFFVAFVVFFVSSITHKPPPPAKLHLQEHSAKALLCSASLQTLTRLQTLTPPLRIALHRSTRSTELLSPWRTSPTISSRKKTRLLSMRTTSPSSKPT
jgi:hypothetical protein